MAIATINPSTGEIIKRFESLSAAQIEQRLQLAASAFQTYRYTSFAERSSKLVRAAEILEEEKDECARLMTLEMGKPLKAAIGEALKCATGCRYYAKNAERFLADELVETGAKRPNTDTLLRLAAALGCELRFAGYILSDIGP